MFAASRCRIDSAYIGFELEFCFILHFIVTVLHRGMSHDFGNFAISRTVILVSFAFIRGRIAAARLIQPPRP